MSVNSNLITDGDKHEEPNMFLLPQQIKRHVNVLKIEKLNDTDEMYRDAALLLQQKTKSLFFQLTP